MGQRTPLYDLHVAMGAKLVDFGGWDMPLHYGSQVDEHHQVRRDCGVFDVSHMAVIDVDGPAAHTWLRGLLAGDLDRLDSPGKAFYTVLLNPQAGIIDDVVLYRLAQGYRLVVNAATRDKDLAWLQQHMPAHGVQLRLRSDLAIFAVQGPAARERVAQLLGQPRAGLIHGLAAFRAAEHDGWLLARTGYTGEDGLEIILPSEQAVGLFNELMGAGVAPIGLGARDTLRLEAGLNLYGQDMDEQHSPWQSNLASAVALVPAQRAFIGRTALEAEQRQGPSMRLVGLVLEERGVLRAHQVVRIAGVGDGEITSGSFSPTLNKSIALARVPAATAERAEVEIRGRWLPVRVVKPTFVRHGKILV